MVLCLQLVFFPPHKKCVFRKIYFKRDMTPVRSSVLLLMVKCQDPGRQTYTFATKYPAPYLLETVFFLYLY